MLEQRLLVSRKTASPADRIPRAAPGDYPLTHVQRRVWAFEQLSPGTIAYNVIWGKSLQGPIDIAALEQAFTALVNRHAMLRATFHSTPDGPVQRISPPVARAEVLRLEANGRPREVSAEVAARVFDLERGPLARATLLRVAEDEQWLLVVMHHLVSDGWTMGIVERELAELYQAFCEKREARLAPLEIDYPDFAAWQSARPPEVAYWVNELSGAPAELGLQTDFARAARTDPAAWVARVPVSDTLLGGLERAARRCDATLYSLLIAVWGVVLHRHGCGEELMIGTPLAGRSRPELAGMVGFLANTLPLRLSVHGDPSFAELVARVKQKVLGAIENQDAAFEVAVERANILRTPGISPGFQTAVAYLESPASPVRLGDLRTGHLTFESLAAQFDAMVFADQYGGQLELSVALRKQIFREETSTAIARHFGRILEAVAADPTQPISRYTMLDAAERAAVVALGTGTECSYPAEAVHVLFEQQARATPDAVALIERERHVSYAELNRMSSRIAAAVAHAGAGTGTIVAVLCDGSAAMVAAFLGVMKAGAAYLPLDAADPPARLALLVAEARAELVLGEQEFSGVKALSLLNLPAAVEPALPIVPPDSAAYAMYTSGSTGVPKAVLVPHRGIVRLVKESGFARLDSTCVFLHMAPPAFDASTFEIWGPLLNGGCAVLYSGRRAALAEIGQAIQRHRVTTLWLTSSLFNAVVDESPEILAPIRQLLIGGEALSVRHVSKALQLLPETEIINGYGPTECTTFACCYSVPRSLDPNAASVPIGTPIGNTTAYILDERCEPVPVGVPGELYLGGDGVALGYLHRPDLTEAAFLPDPFRPGGHRMYRTGDRVRWLPSGAIEFLGRGDAQIKIRGFRVEPGEVEAALQSVPGVGQCAVAAVMDAAGAKQLAAWVVPAAAAKCSAELLRAALASRLPAHMIPSRIAIAARLPLRDNGKLDRSLLPPLEIEQRSAPDDPADEFERGLLVLWRELLGVPEAGVSDDFFLLGGDSLRAIRLTAQIEKRFGQSLPVATVVSASTVRKLAGILRTPQEDQGFVTVTPGGSAWPLVWLDPGRSLQPLASGLGTDQPLHSLTLTPSELAALPEPHRLEDMAARLADKLEQWRPGGPTIVASFCLRTFLAVETARVLRKRGHDVPLVILADPSNPDTVKYLTNPAAPASLAWRAGVHLRRLRTVPVEQWGPLVAHLGRSLLTRVKSQFRADERFALPILAAGARHRLEPYDGPLLVVRIGPEDGLGHDETVRGWSRIAAGRLSVRALSGGHVDLFDPPHVFALAQMIREEITAVRPLNQPL